ncbi:MAG TPA: PAS domain-containing protein, partial [Verrucomicrobiae bacterium]|nr:PAS domain-containing protein [Verrucomicrobiae bacterium]
MKHGLDHTPLTILLVEDNPGDAHLLQEFLSEPGATRFAVEHRQEMATGIERLTQGGIDLVLLDLFLPDSMGLSTFAQFHAAAPDVPVIVMSGLDDESLAIKTVHEGAQDYLVKGHVDSRLLSRAIRYAIERNETEEALAKERDLLHTLLDNLPDRIYFKDRKSRFLRISRAVAEQFQINDPREARGKTDLDFFAAEHAQVALEDERQVMASGIPILNKIEREILPGGNVTWALTSKMPLRDRKGTVIGNFGISRNITELKKIEDQLEAERNLLRSLIDNLPDYIYVKDAQSRYWVDNIAHRRFLGVDSFKEVSGKTATDFFPPEIAQRVGADDHAIIQTGRPLVNREELIVDPQ